MKTITSIQKYFSLALALCLGLTAHAQLLNETFDSDTGFSIADQNGAATFFSDNSHDYFGIYDGDGDGDANFGAATANPSGTESYTSTSGDYIVGEDLDGEGATDPFILTWSSISLSGETTLRISADFASTRMDPDDGIKVSYRLDGGTWVDILGICGAPSTYNSFPYEITDFAAGTGDNTATQVTRAFTNLSNTITLAGTETTIELKAEFETGNSSDNLAMDNLVLEELSGSEEQITLSATATTVDESSSLAVTLSVPTNVSTDTTFNLSSDGDGSELSVPATATILAGTNTIDFSVSGLSDSVYDGNQDVAITADLEGYFSATLEVTVVDAESAPPLGDIIFTQYYEGSSNNKWVEITNTGTDPVDLSSYEVTLWNNATTEAWKTSGGTPYKTLSLSGVTLAAGESYVIANTQSALPYSSSLANATSEITYFNGDDSLVLYSDPTGYLIGNILDAIAFTDAGNEGSNKGFVRTAASYGYDLVTGSSIEDYDDDDAGPAVWTEITTATADSATLGDDAYLGSSSLVVPPTSVNLTATAQSLAEADGNIEIGVQAVGLTSGIVTVQVDFNADNSTADLTDIDYPTAQQLTFDASSLVSPQTITIPIVDDGLDGGTEIASFDLSIISGTANLAAPSTQNVSITDSDFVIPDLIISEVADPGDVYQARFVELYNPTDSTIDLAAGNWSLARFVNGSTTGSSLALTGTVASGETYIIASTSSFDGNYSPVTADQTNSVASGNGDDVYALYFGGNAASGTLVDIYGVIGTDGSGETWEYENARAVRNVDITTPNATLDVSQWTISSANVADMTPGVHPDPSVDEPTGVTASAFSDSEISVAFAAISSNDVIIVFDADNTFTAPSGDAPSVGDSFAGGTVIYKGQVSPFAHTGLTSGTQYYYSVFSVNGTDYSSTVEVNATTLVAGLIDLEDFEDSIPGWQTATVSGDDIFEIVTSTGTNSASIDGSSNSGADNIYLVSPVFDLSGKADGVISFDFAGGYASALSTFELVYSTDYSGSGDPEGSATWTGITYDFSTNLQVDAPTGLTASGDVSLPAALDGVSTFYLAFRYTSDGSLTGSEYWYLDNILVTASDAVAADPIADYLTLRSLTTGDLATDSNGNGFTVLEEYLAGFGDGSGPDAISYGINNGALTLTSDLESAPSGITVVLEATSDLSVAFAPVAFTTSVVDNSDGSYTRSYTETTPPAGGQRFLRLSITSD
jgi:carbon monoxide dehydrogenase subunit G